MYPSFLKPWNIHFPIKIKKISWCSSDNAPPVHCCRALHYLSCIRTLLEEFRSICDNISFLTEYSKLYDKIIYKKATWQKRITIIHSDSISQKKTIVTKHVKSTFSNKDHSHIFHHSIPSKRAWSNPASYSDCLCPT